ncbi:MAG TPA: RNA methyltransferase [Microvirga sp.]|nr:RNA methyltransferase [Microvirga sp.]
MRETVPILDAEDPRIEPYRAVRERDLVGRQGRFVAEGEVVLRVLLARSRFAVESLLLLESQVEKLASLLAGLPPVVPVYTVSRSVMDAIVGFAIHRGILAIGRRGPETSADDLLARLPDRALVLGLVGLTNHDNVGGIFRNAAAFGAGAVLLDPDTCDPLYRKAVRVSVGGSLVVPFARAPSASALCDALDRAGFETVALSPAGREFLSATARAPRTALLLGAEGPGLPDAILARCRTASIPMAGGFDSLNVATASGIALHHFAGFGRA